MAKLSNYLIGAAVVALAVSGSSAAAEQTDSIAAMDGSGGDQARQSDDAIVVTARKRAEALQDVPAVITAFGAEQIDRLKIKGIDDLAAFTPGLQASDGSVSSGGSISLRGVGSGSSRPQGADDYMIQIDISRQVQ